jgi:ATP phosphoribosyltransferase
VAELLDLGFGACQLVLAVPKTSRISESQEIPPGSRVATKYTRLTEQYFSKLEKPVEIVKLYGSVELAPGARLADAITDLTATGKTLQKLNLRVVDVLLESTARLIANPVRLKVKYGEIWDLCSELSAKGKPKKSSKRS